MNNERITSLYTWVEGDDDDRFVKKIIIPLLYTKYGYVADPIKYSNQKNEKVDNYISSLNAMKSDYILFGDINSSPCVTDKKEKLMLKYKRLEINKILVVQSEIESWYYAGITKSKCEEWGIPFVSNTNVFNKEQFNQIHKFTNLPRVVFLNAILDNYSVDTAKSKNTSFEYFCMKFNI